MQSRVNHGVFHTQTALSDTTVDRICCFRRRRSLTPGGRRGEVVVVEEWMDGGPGGRGTTCGEIIITEPTDDSIGEVETSELAGLRFGRPTATKFTVGYWPICG
jgi:hypothetical protein